MTVLSIPLSPELAAYSEQVELEGVTYTLRFRWNTRLEAWFLTVYDEDEETIVVAPRRVVTGQPLNEQFRYLAEAPPGSFLAFDTTHRDIDPGLAEFGTRVKLLYAEAE